jgi:hypothetical protein
LGLGSGFGQLRAVSQNNQIPKTAIDTNYVLGTQLRWWVQKQICLTFASTVIYKTVMTFQKSRTKGKEEQKTQSSIFSQTL